MLNGSSIWLGQHEDFITLSLGDFGTVRVELVADVFKKKTGVYAYITSCKVLLFAQRIEFLHRLNDRKKQDLEEYLASKFSKELGNEYY